MIVITSIDPEALRERSEPDVNDFHVLKSLARVLRQHGVLHLTGPEDERQLRAAVAGLDQSIRETWDATLSSLDSLDRIRRDDGDVPTGESCMTSPLMAANLRPSDLVVLSKPACEIQSVPRIPGHLRRSDEPELASAPAASNCDTVERVEELVLHPFTGQGESRELTWTNHMAPLARLADREVEVRVLDRYLFKQFLDYGKVADLRHVDWLLAKLNDSLPPDVKVHLIAQDIVRRQAEVADSWNRRRRKRRRQLREWLNSHVFTTGRSGALRVSLCEWRKVGSEEEPPKGKPHDRHFRFNTWVALATPEGFDRVGDDAVLGEDGMVLNRVMATNDEGRVGYFASLLRKEDAVLDNVQWDSDILNHLQPGMIRTGLVSSIADFGAFIDIGGVDGLVRNSDLSSKRINHPSEVVEVGQDVTVDVLRVDADRKHVSLSLMSTQARWQHFARTHQVGQVVPGMVTRVVKIGAFVRIGEGVDGLVHRSELSEDSARSPEQVVTVNDDIFVKVIDIDLERRRISLSLKQANEDGTGC